MNVVIFGATGGTGRLLLAGAIARGHAVTAFVRNPARLPVPSGARVVVGDARERRAVDAALEGQQAVLFALGPRTIAPHPLLERAGTNVVSAMDRAGVDRAIVLGAAGALRDPGMHLDRPARLGFAVFKATLLRAPMRMQARLQTIFEGSDRDYTVVLPPRLLDGPPLGTYRVLLDGLPENGLQLRRADLAEFMLDCLDRSLYVRQAPFIAN